MMTYVRSSAIFLGWLLLAAVAVTSLGQQQQNACQQPPDSGRCRARILMYYYNAAKGQCQVFNYGGCGGNANRFRSEAACMEACKRAVPQNDVCKQPKVIGLCRAAFRRWYYDSVKGQCRRFIYGGCYGNDNNFHSRKSCQKRCESGFQG